MAICCPTDKLAAKDVEYKPLGNFTCEYNVVLTAEPKKRAVLFIPDIFGYHPHTVAIADAIANRGNYRVYFPEFFAKSEENPLGPWPMDAVPGQDERWPAFYKYITNPALFKRIAGCAARLKEETGLPPLVIGFCWGSAAGAVLSQTEGLIAGVAMPHPSFVTEESASKTTVPYALFCSKDEDKEAYEKVRAKLAERKLLGDFQRYDDVHHGFAAARFEPTEACKKAREEVIEKTLAFFATLE